MDVWKKNLNGRDAYYLVITDHAKIEEKRMNRIERVLCYLLGCMTMFASGGFLVMGDFVMSLVSSFIGSILLVLREEQAK